MSLPLKSIKNFSGSGKEICSLCKYLQYQLFRSVQEFCLRITASKIIIKRRNVCIPPPLKSIVLPVVYELVPVLKYPLRNSAFDASVREPEECSSDYYN